MEGAVARTIEYCTRAPSLWRTDHAIPEHALQTGRMQDQNNWCSARSWMSACPSISRANSPSTKRQCAKYWLTDTQGLRCWTNACNCTVGTASCKNMRSREMWTDARVPAHLWRHKRDHERADARALIQIIATQACKLRLRRRFILRDEARIHIDPPPPVSRGGTCARDDGASPSHMAQLLSLPCAID